MQSSLPSLIFKYDAHRRQEKRESKKNPLFNLGCWRTTGAEFVLGVLVVVELAELVWMLCALVLDHFAQTTKHWISSTTPPIKKWGPMTFERSCFLAHYNNCQLTSRWRVFINITKKSQTFCKSLGGTGRFKKLGQNSGKFSTNVLSFFIFLFCTRSLHTYLLASPPTF